MIFMGVWQAKLVFAVTLQSARDMGTGVMSIAPGVGGGGGVKSIPCLIILINKISQFNKVTVAIDNHKFTINCYRFECIVLYFS